MHAKQSYLVCLGSTLAIYIDKRLFFEVNFSLSDELNVGENVAYVSHSSSQQQQEVLLYDVVRNIQSTASHQREDGKCSVQDNPAYGEHSTANQDTAQESEVYEAVDSEAECSTVLAEKEDASVYEDVSKLEGGVHDAVDGEAGSSTMTEDASVYEDVSKL